MSTTRIINVARYTPSKISVKHDSANQILIEIIGRNRKVLIITQAIHEKFNVGFFEKLISNDNIFLSNIYSEIEKKS